MLSQLKAINYPSRKKLASVKCVYNGLSDKEGTVERVRRGCMNGKRDAREVNRPVTWSREGTNVWCSDQLPPQN